MKIRKCFNFINLVNINNLKGLELIRIGFICLCRDCWIDFWVFLLNRLDVFLRRFESCFKCFYSVDFFIEIFIYFIENFEKVFKDVYSEKFVRMVFVISVII